MTTVLMVVLGLAGILLASAAAIAVAGLFGVVLDVHLNAYRASLDGKSEERR